MKEDGGCNITMKLNREETFNVWANRYMKDRRKRLLIFLAASIMLTIVAWGFMYARNAAYSYGAMTFMIPVVFLALKTSKASGKYARNKMK